MTLTARLRSCLPLAALLTLPFARPAAATNTAYFCDHVDISVTNKHPSGDPIKVLYVEYWNGWAWVSEGLENKVPNQNVTVTWNNQNLNSLDEGFVSWWRVYFKRQLTGGWFPSYDDTHYQEFDRSNHPCEDYDSFSFTVDESGQLAD